MAQSTNEHFVEANGLRTHYLDYQGKGKPVLLLHSLSANAYIFNGLISSGLSKNNRIIIPDLRGRGETDKPSEGYSLEEESKDLLAFMDALQLDNVILAGHSFGGLLGIYFTAHYPERVSKLIIMDAAVELNPMTPMLITYSTARLFQIFPNWETYLTMMKNAPFMTTWDEALLPFLKHDVKETGNGTLVPTASWMDVAKAAGHLFSVSALQWRQYLGSISCATMVLQAKEPFVLNQFIVPEEKAIQAVALLKNGSHYRIDGNHLTMLYGSGAKQINQAIGQFLSVKQYATIVG